MQQYHIISDGAPKQKFGSSEEAANTSESFYEEEASPFRRATAGHRFGEEEYTSESEDYNAEDALMTTELDIVKDRMRNKSSE